MTMQYEKLVKLGATTTQLGEKALENLKKERPELAAILKSTDTVAGMYAKWRVLLAGVNIDLKSITSEQAMGIAAYEQALALAEATGAPSTKRYLILDSLLICEYPINSVIPDWSSADR